MNAVHVAICIATFRRPEGLRRLVQSLGALTFAQMPPPRMTIVVVDNDVSTAPAPDLLAELRSQPLPLIYVVEPKRGLAAVRNACLDHAPANADFVAFVDDDEWVAPQWLEALLITQQRTAADIVQGPVQPVFACEAAKWMRDGGYYEVGPFDDGARLHHGASGNVLIRTDALRRTSARFHLGFDRSGGEDVDFFQQMLSQGSTIVAATQAVAFEAVPVERMTLRWVLKRRFRTGHTLGQIGRRQGGLGVRVVKSLGRMAAGVGQTAIGTVASRTLAVKGLTNIAWALGTLAAIAGTDVDHYTRR
jgi:glycosyltransferase involved in cell wall biosynthesis